MSVTGGERPITGDSLEDQTNVLTAANPSELESATATRFPTIGSPMQPRRFAVTLAGVVLFGLAFRVGYVLLVTRHQTGKFYDSFWYSVTSSELSRHQFFRIPFHTAPTASHPPLTTFLIGPIGFIIPHG